MKQAIARNKDCFYCGEDNPIGLKLTYFLGEDKVTAEFIPDKKYGASDKTLHPGIGMGVMVEAMGWVPAYTLKGITVLADFTARALKPLPLGKKLIVIAQPVSINHWISEISAVIKDEDGNIYYKATGKYAVIKPGIDSENVYEHYPK